jgi:hypothetical protein
MYSISDAGSADKSGGLRFTEETMPGVHVKVPRQLPESNDCGIFLLNFAARFIEMVNYYGVCACGVLVVLLLLSYHCGVWTPHAVMTANVSVMVAFCSPRLWWSVSQGGFAAYSSPTMDWPFSSAQTIDRSGLAGCAGSRAVDTGASNVVGAQPFYRGVVVAQADQRLGA